MGEEIKGLQMDHVAEGQIQERLSESEPVSRVLDFANALTRERNEQYLKTDMLRVAHMLAGGGEVLDTIERVKPDERMHEILPSVLAKVALRIFTVLQGLKNKDEIIAALTQKFPESGCSYCGHKPCVCSVARPEEKMGAEASPLQAIWTVRNWQQHLHDVYGPNNTEQGLRFVYGRLLSEMNEVNIAVMQMEMSPEEAERFRQEAVSELADSFAWVIAVANETGIDLERALVDRYGGGCPNCGNVPCSCGPFTFVQERKVQK
jgi:NTP pyrophosphatase (non-canonical NTP hydrolase)